jgi:hypothetical protein
VSDKKAKKVFSIDSSFQLIKTIGNDLNDIRYISIDSNNLYLSHFLDDIVSIFNLNYGQLITKIEIESPIHSIADLNNIYIVSNFDGELDIEKRKLKKIEKGNYINIVSNYSLNIITKIQFDNWHSPRSIYLSNDGNLYTIAHDLDDKKIWSRNRYLFQINKENTQIINKTELNGIEYFYDIIHLNDKIILCGVNYNGNETRMIEFD